VNNGTVFNVISCQAVPMRARVTAAEHFITGTVDVVPASRWVFVEAVSGHRTLTPSVCPAVSSLVTRPSTSAVVVACQRRRSVTENLLTVRQHHPLSPFSLRNSFVTWYAKQLTSETSSLSLDGEHPNYSSARFIFVYSVSAVNKFCKSLWQ